MNEGPPHVKVLEVLFNVWISQAVSALAKLGIADQVESGPKTVAEIAAATGAKEEFLYR